MGVIWFLSETCCLQIVVDSIQHGTEELLLFANLYHYRLFSFLVPIRILRPAPQAAAPVPVAAPQVDQAKAPPAQVASASNAAATVAVADAKAGAPPPQTPGGGSAESFAAQRAALLKPANRCRSWCDRGESESTL